LNCPKCDCDAVLYPEGIEGEKICGVCGTVIDEIPSFKGYAQWTPEWYSTWSDQDSETLKEWLTTLRAVTCQLNIPNYPYREEAARTIRTQKNSLFKSQKLSKNKRETVAGLIHLTLKEYNKLRPIKEISKELSLNPKTVLKQTWLLSKILNAKKRPFDMRRKNVMDYLHEYAGKVTKDKDLILSAEAVLMRIQRSGGNPIGVAAGSLYYVCKKSKIKISKEEIGEAFRISARTVYTNEARIRALLAAKLDENPLTVGILADPLVTCQN